MKIFSALKAIFKHQNRPDELIVEAIRELFIDDDPQGLIQVGAPDDEYDTEIAMVVELAPGIRTIDELQAVLLGVFQRGFGTESAGTLETYGPLANKLWQVLYREGLIGVY